MKTKIVILLIGGGLAALIIIPIGWQLGGALATNAIVVGTIGLLLGAIVLSAAVGGLRVLFAHGRLAEAKARQAEYMPLQNGQPAHFDDYAGVAKYLIEPMLHRDYDVKMALAERSQYPNLTTYHHAPHISTPAAPIDVTPAAAAPLLVSSDASRPRLQQLRERGLICRSGKSLMVGASGATPAYIELPECGFIAVAGQPRVGKSTEVKFLLAQFALMGWHFAIADPHIHKEDGLINATQPISGRAIRLAVTPEEVADLVRYVDKIGRARVNGDADRTPVLMVIDEFSNFVLRQLLPDDVLRVLPAMAMEYAGVGVHGLIIGHDWSKNLLGGDLGAALRRAITHRLVLRIDQQNAEFLLPNTALSRQAAGLTRGQALYWGTEAPATIEIPWIGTDDLIYAAQGTPPRPYRPQLASAAPRRPPAGPIAAPLASVPPTVELPPPTVKDQIVMLLEARAGQWLTHSEIATALGIDLEVIRTEAKDLYDAGIITRRPTKRGGERVEYTTNQRPTNRHYREIAA